MLVRRPSPYCGMARCDCLAALLDCQMAATYRHDAESTLESAKVAWEICLLVCDLYPADTDVDSYPAYAHVIL